MYHYHFEHDGENFDRTRWNSTEFKAVMRVVLGDHTLWQRDGTEVIADISEVIVHPEYSKILKTSHCVRKKYYQFFFFADIPYYRNDIALLRLSFKVPLSDYVTLGCLPQPGDVALALRGNRKCVVVGWGYDGHGNSNKNRWVDILGGSQDSYFCFETEFPATPNELSLPLLSRHDCDQKYGHLNITRDMICVQSTATEDACNVCDPSIWLWYIYVFIFILYLF